MTEDDTRTLQSDRDKLEAQVAAHPFLTGLGAHHIRLLADCAMRSHFRAGEVIFRENEAANRFYLVEHGKVALESSTLDEPVKIDEISDGDLLGWSWLFPPYAWDLTALTNYAQKAAKEEMSEVVSSLESQEIIVKGVIELGAPAQAICDYARNYEVDLIVTATHGSTGLTHILLGSTAEHVVRYAHCPVLVMPSYAQGGKHE
jgi:nucleotide-binding universal stress UspA family protein